MTKNELAARRRAALQAIKIKEFVTRAAPPAAPPAPVATRVFALPGELETRFGAIAAALTGPTGERGVPGIPGVDGQHGETGPAGATGPQGVIGPQGIAGERGTPGAAVTGPAGERGAQGAQGPAGIPGALWRGAYVPGTKYKAGDVVQHDGSSWIATGDTSSAPGGAGWEVVAKKGEPGKNGMEARPRGAVSGAATVHTSAPLMGDGSTASPVSLVALTSDVPDSLNRRYVTDAALVVLGNTSGTNTGDQTSVSGNAGTATALQNARTINGTSFNGTANITVADATKVGLTGAETIAGVKTFSDGVTLSTLAPIVMGNALNSYLIGGGAVIRLNDSVGAEIGYSANKLTFAGALASFTKPIGLPATDSSGTPGAVTINQANGRAAIAIGASTVTVTNSTVAAADTVIVTGIGRDATCRDLVVDSVSAGSFVVSGNANATAATKFSFLVIKAI